MRTLASLLFIALLVVYVSCLAPNWGPMTLFNTWDGLEYVICANLLGIDHPPGHPAYLLLGRLYTMLPFGDPSWNINLISALFGAAAIALLSLAVYEGLKSFRERIASMLISLAAGLTLAFSYVFWSHCEIPEVHTLFLALAGLCMYAVVRWHREGGVGWLALASLALALNIGVNILGTFALAVPVAILVVLSDRGGVSRRRLILPVVIVAAGFLSYLYYPIRLMRAPLYSHPMNYFSRHEMGSGAWYIWYIAGKAWTGGQMFFAHRVAGNIPLYIRFAARDLGFPLFLCSLAGIVLAVVQCVELAKALLRGERERARETMLLPFFLILFLFSLLPEISIHDPSNPRAYAYLQNFFLPSLYLLVVPAAYGAMKAYCLLKTRSVVAAAVLAALLLAMPIYQCAVNATACNLRGQECAYTLSLRTLEQIPDRSVIVSKLVYGMVVEYFTRVERKIPVERAAIYDPELVTRKMTREAGARDFFARRNRGMLEDIQRMLKEGTPVFMAGDVVDEDKSPEKLLLADLQLNRWEPALSPAESRLLFPRELNLYRVSGLRSAAAVKSVPAGVERGSANDGAFANGIELLGFRPAPPDRRIREDLLTLELFWKSSRPLTGDVYVAIIFMDASPKRIGEPCWHTLGGTLSAGQWREGAVVAEQVNIFPPPLPPGRYFLGIGMVDDRGVEVKYLPRDASYTGRTYDYILLAPFDLGLTPYARELWHEQHGAR